MQDLSLFYIRDFLTDEDFFRWVWALIGTERKMIGDAVIQYEIERLLQAIKENEN